MKNNREYLNKLIDLFITFFKIGLFTFGGGYAMIPLMEREILKKNWLSREEILDFFALSQSIPGAISINACAFIGHKIAGRRGTFAALFGVILPSFIIIVIIAAFFTEFQELPIVQKAFLGIRTGVVGLILVSVIKMGKNSVIDIPTALIALVTIIFLLFVRLHPILIIIAGALTGILLNYISPRKMNDTNEKGDY